MEKEKIAKTTMSLQAETLLNQMVTKANHDFTGGRVTKHDMLSWIVTCFSENYFDRNLERIHQDHFDRLAHVDHLLKSIKKARSEGIENSDAELQLKQMVDNMGKSKERQPKQTKLLPEAG